MLRLSALVLVAAVASPALAQEPKGCDAFKWPVAREHALLRTATATKPSGTEFADASSAEAVRIALQPIESAKLPMPPERSPRAPSTFAGFVTFAKVGQPGLYAVSLSDNGWIDVIQGGIYLKPLAFSGATGCDGLRKTVKFRLESGPLTIQVTGVAGGSIAVSVTPFAN
jgi:hypothetical protein